MSFVSEEPHCALKTKKHLLKNTSCYHQNANDRLGINAILQQGNNLLPCRIFFSFSLVFHYKAVHLQPIHGYREVVCRQTAPPVSFESRHIKRRLLQRSVLDKLESCNLLYKVLNMAMGRCSRDVFILIVLAPPRNEVYSYLCGFYACSFNFIGHARASVCGTGKSIVPTFFMCRNQLFHNF